MDGIIARLDEGIVYEIVKDLDFNGFLSLAQVNKHLSEIYQSSHLLKHAQWVNVTHGKNHNLKNYLLHICVDRGSVPSWQHIKAMDLCVGVYTTLEQLKKFTLLEELRTWDESTVPPTIKELYLYQVQNKSLAILDLPKLEKLVMVCSGFNMVLWTKNLKCLSAAASKEKDRIRVVDCPKLEHINMARGSFESDNKLGVLDTLVYYNTTFVLEHPIEKVMKLYTSKLNVSPFTFIKEIDTWHFNGELPDPLVYQHIIYSKKHPKIMCFNSNYPKPLPAAEFVSVVLSSTSTEVIPLVPTKMLKVVIKDAFTVDKIVVPNSLRSLTILNQCGLRELFNKDFHSGLVEIKLTGIKFKCMCHSFPQLRDLHLKNCFSQEHKCFVDAPNLKEVILLETLASVDLPYDKLSLDTLEIFQSRIPSKKILKLRDVKNLTLDETYLPIVPQLQSYFPKAEITIT